MPVPITPSVLQWAIEQSGHSVERVADCLEVTADELRAWQKGPAQPTLTKLKKLAHILHRPAAAFLLPEPPESVRPQVEFRHPPGAGRRSLNAVELRYLRTAGRLQRALAWISDELGEAASALPQVRVGSDAEALALETRRELNVSLETQYRWTTHSQALQIWRGALERAGILVFLLPLGKESCRGFSLWNERAPVIAVNTWWNSAARIFTLFHEYGHLLTRTSSACLDSGLIRTTHGDQAERWCEHLAACVLMPWESVEHFLREDLRWASGRTVNDLAGLRHLAQRFKVSLRAAALRLIHGHAATWDLYAKIPSASDQKQGGGGGGGRKRRQIREDWYGSRTTRLFLSAIDKDVLTRTDVLGYLDVSDADLDSLQPSSARRYE
jgi:Zn-dependent peptidase ImmA (M78 family)